MKLFDKEIAELEKEIADHERIQKLLSTDEIIEVAKIIQEYGINWNFRSIEQQTKLQAFRTAQTLHKQEMGKIKERILNELKEKTCMPCDSVIGVMIPDFGSNENSFVQLKELKSILEKEL